MTLEPDSSELDLEELALFGDTLGQVMLGFLLESGYGVRQDGRSAEGYYRQAAEGECPLAEYRLYALISTYDKHEALNWLQDSASRGYPPSQNALALERWPGSRDAKKRQETLTLLEAAASRSYTPATKNAAVLLGEQGECGSALRESQKEAYLRQAADAGDPQAAQMLSDRLREDKDEGKQREAFELLRKAASKGEFFALFALAGVYGFGELGVRRDKHTSDLLNSLCDRPEDFLL